LSPIKNLAGVTEEFPTPGARFVVNITDRWPIC